MTKQEMLNAGLALINESTADKKKTKEQLAEAFLALMAEYKGSKDKSESTKRQTIIERDGITYKYCNRHEQYEPIDTFNIKSNKDGVITYNPECSVATAKWLAYNSDIIKAEKQVMSLIDDVDELRKQVAHINELKELRGGKYDKTGIDGIAE
jgi:hypothetical protein